MNTAASMATSMDLSVVVPLYNEEESLPHLVQQLLDALRPSGIPP